ncbi:MAG: transcriptional repressor [Bacilli bacterium]
MQRETILKVIQNSCEHLNTEIIYDMVKKEIPNISLGTIYRNLNQLVELKQIKKIYMAQGSDCYDKTLNLHSHLYCNKCHKIYDINNFIIENITNQVQNYLECEITNQDLLFCGICKQCQEKKEG